MLCSLDKRSPGSISLPRLHFRAMPVARALLAAATAASSLSSASSFLVAPTPSLCGTIATRPSFDDGARSSLLCLRRTTTTATSKSGGSVRGRPGGGCSMMAGGEPAGEEGKFIRMGGTEDAQRFGPRCILASGLQLDDFRAARSILEEDQDRLGVTPLVLLTPEIADQRVGDVLTDAAEISSRQEEKEEGAEGESLTSPVILISGFTNTELRDFASRFRSATGVRAAFAKAVPNAMVKAAAAVCGEIAQDHADAMAGRLHD